MLKVDGDQNEVQNLRFNLHNLRYDSINSLLNVCSVIHSFPDKELSHVLWLHDAVPGSDESSRGERIQFNFYFNILELGKSYVAVA